MKLKEQLGRHLQAAHIPVTPERYLLLTILLTLTAAVLWTAVWALLLALNIRLPLPEAMPRAVIYLVCSLLIPAGVFLFTFYYPQMKAGGRKSRINLDLPYAITYMQALSQVLPLADIFRSVYDVPDLYGEVSNECGMIVRNMDVFGEDVVTAMEEVKKTSPSESFRELLNDLILVQQSGGELTSFFNAKSESYREIARSEMDSLLQFLEMIAEVYVTAFVAGPIAIIIMLVAQNLAGQNMLEGISTVMYVGIPAGAIILIAIMYILLPPDNLAITKKEFHETEYTADILSENEQAEPDAKFLKKIEQKRKRRALADVFRHPLKHYIAKYDYGIAVGCVLALLVFASYYFGYFAAFFPTFTLECCICCMVIAGFFPVMAAYEIRNRYVSRIEKQLPELLREIADMRDIGMTLQGAISLIANHKHGVLSSEIKIVTEELQYGASLSSALVRMEERVGLVSVKRAISLLVKASEITTHIREILAIAVSDLEHYLKMKHKRSSVSLVYLAVIYLSFGIYLYAAYQMNVMFISSFSAYDITFDLAANKMQMFDIGLILAVFSGIMAGQMSANSIFAGFKHSIIMVLATLIGFVYII